MQRYYEEVVLSKFFRKKMQKNAKLGAKDIRAAEYRRELNTAALPNSGLKDPSRGHRQRKKRGKRGKKVAKLQSCATEYVGENAHYILY